MKRRRDPTPFGSRERDTPDPNFMLLEAANPGWETDGVGRGRLKPEFFQMLREFRFTRIRLIVEAVALATGVVMFFVMPLVGLIIIVITVVAGIFDLVLFASLRRRIRESWEDLSQEAS